MTEPIQNNYLVAVIGAGPAGLYASQYLARLGVQVVLFNRDIKPGGLAEYGIYPDKHKMRTGLLAQFRRILEMDSVHYQGNVNIGQSGEIKLDQLRQVGIQAFMVTTGAQTNNWLGLPGEDLDGVYQANDIVFHYNHLPAHAGLRFTFGHQVAVIGLGNVMMDIVHYLKQEGGALTVTAYGRRGPTEVKFDQQTLEPIADCLNLEAIRAAVDAVDPQLQSVGKDASGFFAIMARARQKAADCDSGLDFRFRFLRSPRRLVGDDSGRVKQIVFEVNRLELRDDQLVSIGTGELETVVADSVIFSIGSRVDEGFGLPVEHGNFVTTSNPRFPVDGISYEVFNPELCAQCEDIFVSGWARKPSDGIVGLARKDAERGARAVIQYLQSLELAVQHDLDAVIGRLPSTGKTVVGKQDLEKIWQEEQKIAAKKGLSSFKFSSKEAMLEVIRRS